MLSGTGTQPSAPSQGQRLCVWRVWRVRLLILMVCNLLKGLAVHERWLGARALYEMRSNSGFGKFDFH